MPRKLKTYITNLGFFELALAAPSMSEERVVRSTMSRSGGPAKATNAPSTGEADGWRNSCPAN